MARIKSSKPSMTFTRLQNEADSLGETNDCTVKAIAIVCDVSYKVAHAALKKAGRKNRKGAYVSDQRRAVKELGFEMVRVDRSFFIDRYPGNHKNLKSVTTHHMQRFWKVWCDGDTYLIYTSRHVGAVINGVNHDWTKGRAMRACNIYRIVKKVDDTPKQISKSTRALFDL
jgi:hypothetical protein